jgi:hypothetical protein
MREGNPAGYRTWRAAPFGTIRLPHAGIPTLPQRRVSAKAFAQFPLHSPACFACNRPNFRPLVVWLKCEPSEDRSSADTRLDKHPPYFISSNLAVVCSLRHMLCVGKHSRGAAVSARAIRNIPVHKRQGADDCPIPDLNTHLNNGTGTDIDTITN